MSSDNEEHDDSDKEPTDVEAVPHIKSSKKAFSKLKIELSDDDLSSPGVQKMLLAEIERLESTALASDGFKGKFHQKDKECAVLKEKDKTFVFSEILYSVSLALGAALLGITPSLTATNVSLNVVWGIGVLLVIGALVAKVVKK